MARRRSILASDTNAYRVVDGVADGFQGIEIDAFGDVWLAQSKDGNFPDELQSIAPEFCRTLYGKRLDSAERESPRLLVGTPDDAPALIRESGLRYEVSFAAGYSQGIFLDQRENRAFLRDTCDGVRLLNCFAYTCAFGVAAAAGGATTLNLDLSRSYLDWGKRNYTLNNLDPAAHDFIHGDVFDWMQRFAKRGRLFDVVVLDPPTFSRNRNGVVFRVERGYEQLVSLATKVLAPGGRILCCTNCRTLPLSQFRTLVQTGCAGGGKWSYQTRAMPSDFRGDPYLKTLLATQQAAL